MKSIQRFLDAPEPTWAETGLNAIALGVWLTTMVLL